MCGGKAPSRPFEIVINLRRPNVKIVGGVLCVECEKKSTLSDMLIKYTTPPE